MPDAPVAGEGAMAPRVPAQGRAPAGNRLLMHMCCGPCACICIQRLQAEGWNITGYYMNPNIQPLA
ncbi:MAG: epoxyqueuosine reductase QueH, partial [Desulfovibrio sp.]|nr:epoxyqueuosine reductase QueH [Desulfovibrio sp.]